MTPSGKKSKGRTLDTFPPLDRGDGGGGLARHGDAADSEKKGSAGHEGEKEKATGPHTPVEERMGGATKTTPEPSGRKPGPNDTPAPFPNQPPVGDTEGYEDVLEPGEVLQGDFEIRYVLGSGSMGVVYLGEDLSLRRPVAIKVLARDYGNETDIVEKFRREAVAMAAVRHHNVVQIYSFGIHQGRSFFVMEYVEGKSLADLVENRRSAGELTPLDEAVGIMAQACRGVEAIHRQSIVHRDLKPANILLGRDYRVAVADFGLVRKAESTDGQGLDLDGTPMYLAPERIRGTELESGYAHLCDIYSLGAIFYEVLTGYPPYESDSIMAVLDSHLIEDPPTPSAIRPELPSAIDRIVHRAMAKNPCDRFSSCREMEAALLEGRTAVVGEEPEVVRRNGGKLRSFVVVDSDPEFLERFCCALEQACPDATIYQASDGAKGMRLATETNAQVVVCEQDAHGKNALELCSTLTGNRATAPSIVVLAKKVDRLQRQLFKDLGAVDLVAKGDAPADLAELVLELAHTPKNLNGNSGYLPSV